MILKMKEIGLHFAKHLIYQKDTVEIEMNCNVCVHKSHYTSKKER